MVNISKYISNRLYKKVGYNSWTWINFPWPHFEIWERCQKGTRAASRSWNWILTAKWHYRITFSGSWNWLRVASYNMIRFLSKKISLYEDGSLDIFPLFNFIHAGKIQMVTVNKWSANGYQRREELQQMDRERD